MKRGFHTRCFAEQHLTLKQAIMPAVMARIQTVKKVLIESTKALSMGTLSIVYRAVTALSFAFIQILDQNLKTRQGNTEPAAIPAKSFLMNFIKVKPADLIYF